MAEHSIAHTALSGFRFVREKPGVIVVWLVLCLAFAFGQAVAQVGMAGGVLAQMQALQAHPDPNNPLAALSLFGQLLPFYGLMILISVVFGAVTGGAASRSVLRPAEEGLGYLALGPDELRLIVVSVVVGFILFAVYFVGAIFAGIVGGIFAVALGALPTPGSTQLPGAYLAVLGVAFLPVLAALIFFAIRLSLAFALTVDARAIRIFESWSLTRGRFWRVFGTYVLSALFFLPVAAVGVAVIGGAASILGGAAGAVNILMRPDTSSMAAFFTPARIIILMASAIINALSLAVFARTPAVIYAELADRMPEEVF